MLHILQDRFMDKFKAKIDIIGINPFVFVPAKILNNIFKQANRNKGPIPVRGTIHGNPYRQTLVKYSGDWRLYINNIMLRNSPKRIGETVEITVQFDPVSREMKPHPLLVKALKENKNAKKVFDGLSPSRRKEIVRYISNLKTEESILKNISKVISHLSGKTAFAGRNKP